MKEQDKCQRCGNKDEDLRILWMACFYEMNELSIPFDMVEFAGEVRAWECRKPGPFPNTYVPQFFKHGTVTQQQFYRLLVCKDCRADWMAAIKLWFNERRTPKRGCGSGIFVRENGTNVEISREEWYRRNPGREPVVFKEP